MESFDELLELRNYQELVLDQAKEKNTIAFLPTGKKTKDLIL
jgi:ERCC4-related helicase